MIFDRGWEKTDISMPSSYWYAGVQVNGGILVKGNVKHLLAHSQVLLIFVSVGEKYFFAHLLHRLVCRRLHEALSLFHQLHAIKFLIVSTTSRRPVEKEKRNTK